MNYADKQRRAQMRRDADPSTPPPYEAGRKIARQRHRLARANRRAIEATKGGAS